MPEGLTDKQAIFCEEYLIDLNGKQAAIRAGYSPKTAESQASRLLSNAKVQKYLSERQQQLQADTGITQKRVLEEYAKIAFSDIRKFYTIDGALKPIHDLDDDSAAILAGVEVMEEKVSDPAADEVIVVGQVKKIKTWDKVKALDSLARHLGMFGKDNEQKKVVVQVGKMEVI
jgi:phage terminase small subunit